MPLDPLHKRKLKKNLAVGALVLLWCAVIWIVTMIRIANAQEMPLQADAWRGKTYSGLGIVAKPVDVKGAMYDQRYRHRVAVYDTKESWDADYMRKGDVRLQKTQALDAARELRLEGAIATHDEWDRQWMDTTVARHEQEYRDRLRRAAHNNKTADAPHGWWEAWTARQQEKQAP